MAEAADPWDEYKRRRRSLRLVLLSAVPTVAVAFLLWPSVTVGAIGVVWLGVAVLAGQHVEAWRCPRCGKSFFRAGAWHNAFTTNCLNCDLPKWSLADGSHSATSNVVRSN
jgi:hypothetical protein